VCTYVGVNAFLSFQSLSVFCVIFYLKDILFFEKELGEDRWEKDDTSGNKSKGEFVLTFIAGSHFENRCSGKDYSKQIN
jgi:hypothetical protein